MKFVVKATLTFEVNLPDSPDVDQQLELAAKLVEGWADSRIADGLMANKDKSPRTVRIVGRTVEYPEEQP